MDLSSLTPDKQVKLQYWLDVIRQCRASGLTNQIWCEQHDIYLKSYYYWLSKIRKLALEELPRKKNGIHMCTDQQSTALTESPAEFAELSLPDRNISRSTPAAMLGELSHVEKIYIRCGYTDMRKQLNGLLDIIQYNFKLDPYSNSLFLFCGKRADRIKAVHYEGDGFCLLYKRYENGRLQWPRTGEEAKQISDQQLRWLLVVYRDWLVHIVHRLKLELLKQRYLHIDETHVQVLKEPGRKNTSDSYMWVYCSIRDAVNPIRYFEYQPGRSGKYPEAFLREYEGYIHTDAYSGYNAVSGVKRCLCYTHLRRAFVDALPKDIHNSEASKPAEAILRLNQLFNIESELEALPPDQKKKERLIREKPLLEAFWSWAEKSAIGELPKSKLSKAFHYALNNREGFWNYLEDGNCSISNSLAENCIRPFVIGRKNWLFSGSPKGAEASAGIYTLVETAKANGLAPMKYIKYILSDMPGSAFLEHPEYLDDYLPWNPLVKEFCR